MLGAIIGDIIGSVYEYNNVNDTDFPLFTERSSFTDDTILSIAVCDAVLKGIPYKDSLLWWANRYPSPLGDYGGLFLRWLNSDGHSPYNSYGNGSAMRVSAIGWLYDDIETVLMEARNSAVVTHNHPEGVKGAQAIATGVFMARQGGSKEHIKDHIQERFGYDMSSRIYRPENRDTFDSTCQGTVPLSILCFLETNSYENAIRKAVSLGGDSDTLACMTGALAEAYYQRIPSHILRPAIKRLPYDMWLVLYEFLQRTKPRRKHFLSFFFSWENHKKEITRLWK